MEKRIAALCLVCKTLHTAVVAKEDVHAKSWVTCGCGDMIKMFPVVKAKSYKRALHKCNASCQTAAHFSECNCECGGVNHGARTGYSAGPVNVH